MELTRRLRKPDAPFYDQWESASPILRERVRREKLFEYVDYSFRNIPFYRERLEGFDRKAEHPLSRVPVLTSEDLRKLLPPKSEALLAKGAKGFNVFQSGGTTGRPKTTLFSHEELEGLYHPNARGFYACGLRSSDRVANLFAVGGLYMTFIHIHRMLENYGCVNFPFSNQTPADYVYRAAKLFKINCVAGISSAVLGVLRQMSRLGKRGIKIDKVYYGGEHLYDADKEEIRSVFGSEIILAPGYGTVDTWYIGYQCLKCPTGVFHAHDDECYIEIVNEQTRRPAIAKQPGMLYATPLPRRLTPIIRYRVGDRAQWMGEPCSCGRTTPLFRLLGRGDDVLRIGFDSVDYNWVQAVISKIRTLSAAVQMEKRRYRGRDLLILRVETKASASSWKQIASNLTRQALQERPTLQKLIKNKTVWPLKVELVKPGEIGRNPRTGKLIRVLDRSLN